MTRKIFAIKANDVQFATRYAYNASVRAIEGHIREVAKESGEEWSLVWSAGVKGDDGNHTQGARTWRSTSGREITYGIIRVV